MCLILFAHEVHPDYRLILAANRDEFHDRPTAAAAEWPDAPEVFGGRDLRGGGTWLGVTRSGRWAAVTNVRDPEDVIPRETSRGHLVSGFLTGSASPARYVDSLLPRTADYSGFNLLVGDPDSVYWLANRGPMAGGGVHRRVEPGIYGISNHLLDTPWPKVVRGKLALTALVAAGERLSPDSLLEILLDRAIAADHELPSTGVPLELERALSARFIATPDYGTRSSTAVLIHHGGQIFFAERRFDASARIVGEDHYEL